MAVKVVGCVSECVSECVCVCVCVLHVGAGESNGEGWCYSGQAALLRVGDSHSQEFANEQDGHGGASEEGAGRDPGPTPPLRGEGQPQVCPGKECHCFMVSTLHCTHVYTYRIAGYFRGVYISQISKLL